uniref:Uncharacterized protein n=1 Tax=Gibberella zeae TaxID=5518 RepID=A0A4E9DKA0_GIBZA
MCEYDTIYAETKPAAGEDRVLVDSCVYRILKAPCQGHRLPVGTLPEFLYVYTTETVVELYYA